MEPSLPLGESSAGSVTGSVSGFHHPDTISLQRNQPPYVPENDIYRGSDTQPPPPDSPYPMLRVNSPEIIESLHSSSSSTSSASTRLVARTIARVVELAISRWARSSASSSGSSTSTTSSTPSNVARRRPKRRRRASTTTSTVHIDTAQRALAREALENARRIPREFNLLLPGTYTVQNQTPFPLRPNRISTQPISSSSQLIQTTSLPDILSNIEQAIRDSAKLRREQHKPLRPKLPRVREQFLLPAVIEVRSAEPSRTPSPRCDQVGSEDGNTPPETGSRCVDHPLTPTFMETIPPAGESSGLTPQVTSEDQKGQKTRHHHHLKPPIRASMGMDDLLNGSRGSPGVAAAQAMGGNHPGDVQQVIPEHGSVPLNELWKKAWWLDVASPTWEDMRMLGTVRRLNCSELFRKFTPR